MHRYIHIDTLLTYPVKRRRKWHIEIPFESVNIFNLLIFRS